MLQYIGITIFALYIILFLIIHWRLYRKTIQGNSVVNPFTNTIPVTIPRSTSSLTATSLPVTANATTSMPIPQQKTGISNAPELKPFDTTEANEDPTKVKPSISIVNPKAKNRDATRRNGLLNLRTIPIAPGELQFDDELGLNQVAMPPTASANVDHMFDPLRAFTLKKSLRQHEVEMDDDDDIHKPIDFLDLVIPSPEYTMTAPLREPHISKQLQVYMDQYPEIKPLVMNMNNSQVSDENKRISLFDTLGILSNKGFSTAQLDFICREISGISIRRLCLDQLPYILKRYSDTMSPEVHAWFIGNMKNFEQIVTECEDQSFRTVRTTHGSKEVAAGIKANSMLRFIITHMLCTVAAKKPGILEQGKGFVSSIIQQPST